MKRPLSHSKGRTWPSYLGAAIGLGAIAWILARLDYAELYEVFSTARPVYLALVPLAIAAEQLVRAWKWRQLLHPLRGIPTLRLFSAIMAGYLANVLVPLGLSPIVRSWLVARLEGLKLSAVLASVAVDRLIDAVIFAALVLFVVAFAVFPDPEGQIRLGLVAGGLATLVLAPLVLFALWQHKRRSEEGLGWALRLADRLPLRFADRARAVALSFADGIVWPVEAWRRIAVILSSVVIKLIAASHFLWAGLAFQVALPAFYYFVLLAILGFIVILAHVARIPAGFVVGGIFTLGLFGVGEEQAVAIVTTIMVSSLVTVGLFGAITLWRHGLAISDLTTQEVAVEGRG